MRRKARCAVALLQLAWAIPASAQGDLAGLFPARPDGYVTDVAGVVDAEHARAMTATCQRLRDLTGAEIAVVTLPTIGDRAAVDVAVAIGRAWGVGAEVAVGDERRNAGIVILLVPRRAEDPNSGQIFIATGRGVEGIVTDAMAGRVRDRMRPQLAAGDYGAGLQTGVSALAAIVAEGLGVTDSVLAAGSRAIYRRGLDGLSGGIPVIPIIVLVVLVIIVLAILGSGGGPGGPGGRRRRRRHFPIFIGGPGWGGGFGGSGGGFGGGFGGFGGGGGFGGFGGGGGFSGGGAGGRF